MKIVVLHYGEISDYLPTRSLIENLLDIGNEVTVIARDQADILASFRTEHLNVIKLNSYENKATDKVKAFIINKLKVEKILSELMQKSDMLWITSPEALRYVDHNIFQYRYVLQLMELVENVSRYPVLRKPYLPIKEYAHHAYKIVVPEVNRAYIQRVWWELNERPVVLPNKPYKLPDTAMVTPEIKVITEEMDQETRKKILYQGVFSEERNLNAIAEAVASLQSEVCMYIMGKDDDYKKQFILKYPFVKYIPFQTPPHHLLITQHADIGLLPYVPANHDANSSLNALYCAPNKIYEYAAYGIPMIGSDVLGLVEPFEKYDIGVTCKSFTVENIKQAITHLLDNYQKMSMNCQVFYDDIDLLTIVNNILQ